MKAQTGRNKESRSIGMIRLRDSANIYRPGLGTVSNYVTQREREEEARLRKTEGN